MISFTIATVCFRAEATLGRTLESVAAQDYAHCEHLIIDGASKDGTLALIAQMQARLRAEGRGHRLRLISEPDRGLYDAMNKALRLAEGTYLLFLNAGDKLHSASTLSLLAARIAEHEAQHGALPSVAYGHTDIVDDSGRFLRPRHLTPPAQLTAESFAQGMLVCHQAFFALTRLAKAQPYDLRYRYSADYDWCVRLLRAAENEGLSTLNARAVLADYLSEGLTTAHHRASLRERFCIMARHYGPLRTALRHVGFLFRALRRRA